MSQAIVIDRTLLNIVSLLLGATGLAVVFLDYTARELNASFWGVNLYAVKRDAIAGKRDRSFLAMAATSVFLQLGAEIWGQSLEERTLTSPQYMSLTMAIIALLAALSWILWVAAKRAARKDWQPEVIEGYREAFAKARYLVRHDFIPEAYAEEAARWASEEVERVREETKHQFASTIAHIERLLEVRPSGDLATRIAQLEKYFATAEGSG